MEWAVSTNRWSLKICGIWRDEDYSRFRDAFSNLLLPFYAFLLSILALFPQTLALVKVWGHLTLVVENLLLYLAFVISLWAIVTLWFKKEGTKAFIFQVLFVASHYALKTIHQDDIVQITKVFFKVVITMMNFIMEDWMRLKNQQERKIMIKYTKISRMITFGGYSVIIVTVLVYHAPIIFGVVLRTLTNLTDTGHRPLVLQSMYPIDVYQTPIYQLTVISQILTCALDSFCYTTVGSYFSFVVLHACSQLENLKNSMENMLKSDRSHQIKFQNILRSNVQEHQRLIRFVDMIESTFSIMLLMVYPAFTTIIGVQGFQLVSALCDPENIPMAEVGFCVVYMCFVAFSMFIFSSVGQLLVTQSLDIQDAASNCEWYELSPRESVQFIIILIRAQRPMTITAGKFIPLTLGTFAALLKTTMGYISCLLAVKE